MNLFTDDERKLAEAVAELGSGNPFTSGRQVHEKSILGEEYVEPSPLWFAYPGLDATPNQELIDSRVERLIGKMCMRMEAHNEISNDELNLFEGLVFYRLFHRYLGHFRMYLGSGQRERITFYDTFERDLKRFLVHEDSLAKPENDPGHMFACFFQMAKALEYISANVVGASPAALRTRARVWQSVFSFNLTRYRRSLYLRMGDMTSLVTGEPGTGRRRLARTIASCHYASFDPIRKVFAEEDDGDFQVLELAGKSSEEIESELFGARWETADGLVDQAGLLANCSVHGSVFINDFHLLPMSLQVKLLNLIETHHFQPLGSNRNYSFRGRLIGATAVDLKQAVEDGQLRQDLFYRLRADLVVMPTLAEHVAGRPDEMKNLVRLLAQKVAGDDEAVSLTREVMAFIENQLGMDYSWPGNLRELELCIRQVLLSGTYQPYSTRVGDPRQIMTRDFLSGSMTASEVVNRYTTLVYAQCGSYLETARRLELDRRTVKSKINERLLRQLEGLVAKS